MFNSMLFSTGGDEIDLSCYKNDTKTQSTLKSNGMTIEDALAQFVGAVHDGVHEQNKTCVVWEGGYL